MILEAAIINVTRNLDLISQKEPAAISSNLKIKEEGLSCLIQLIDKAPQAEYKKLIQSEHCDILIGYLFNTLIQLVKNDKSKKIRCQSLKVVCLLVKRLSHFHDVIELGDRCSIAIIGSALPGVSSVLFRLISSDVKLNRELLKASIITLGLFITVAIKPCAHRIILSDDDLKETCENIVIRTSFLIDYMINNASQIHEEVKYEMLSFCHQLVSQTRVELLERVIKTIVKYLAFLSPDSFTTRELKHETNLKKLLITNYILEYMEKDGNHTMQSTVISSLFQLLDELENDYSTMLLSEREGKLSMLHGFLKLLPQKSVTTLLQLSDRRSQMIKVFLNLTEFNTTQPLLFLTDVTVGLQALETNNDRIYTSEKRFTHINQAEVVTITRCCECISVRGEWLTLADFLYELLWSSPHSNQLFINHLFLKGLLSRAPGKAIGKFCSQAISLILELIEETDNNTRTEDTEAEMFLRTVISIETLVTLVELNLKNSESIKEKSIILMTILCPLLNLASSNFRSVSEAALSGLARISQLYEYDSIRGLIEANIDYIVNGLMRLLDSYLNNPEVTNILALTFKLSSIENFYLFKDVYERIFKILSSCHIKSQTRSIALLFYRTLSILRDWKISKERVTKQEECLDKRTIKMIKHNLDIERRIGSLKRVLKEAEEDNDRIDHILKTEVDERRIIEEIQSEPVRAVEKISEPEPVSSTEDEKSTEIIFTEKIMTLCVHIISSDDQETKVLALKAASCGLSILRSNENTLLPLVHQIWSPVLNRLISGDYKQDLEVSMCAFECLVMMAECAKDFIKRRFLDSVLPRLCLFLQTQSSQSKGKKDHGPYCMTIAFKCQLKILSQLGLLSYNTEISYTSLWPVIKTLLIYMAEDQVSSLKQAAASSLSYLIILDADCVWYFANQSGKLKDLPIDQIFDES